jgi:hypothetical protein
VLTVAVNVTDWPKTEGFALDAIVVVVAAGVSVNVKLHPVREVLRASPVSSTA